MMKMKHHRSFGSWPWLLVALVHTSLLLVTLAKFASHNDTASLYYNSNSDTFIRCSFNPLCYCKYDERTEIFDSVIRLWYMSRLNVTNYKFTVHRLISAMTDDPNTVYHVNPVQIQHLAEAVTNTTLRSGPAAQSLHLRLNNLFEYGPVFDIDCDKVPMAQIPTEYSAQGLISHVSIGGSRLLILDGSAFAGLEVQGIRLANNHLYYISEFAFSSMSNALTILDLSANLLDEMPFSAFKTLRVLEWLNLNNNLINSIFGNWFSVANSLRKLLLSENSIDSLPIKLLSQFHRLTWLDLSSNHINNLTFNSLPPNVQTLNLMKNRISHFPTQLFALRSLSWLDLSGCDIENVPTSLPEGIQQVQMNQLDLSNNFIQGWQSKPFGAHLTVLDLSINKNYIDVLPSAAFHSMNIFRLSLGHNRIHQVDPAAFITLDSTLKYLNLENNRLISIPWDSLRNLSSLIHLYLGSNSIQEPGAEFPEGFDCKLTHLGLNRNSLTRIPKHILTHCPHLVHLNLGYNQITHLDDLAHILLHGKKLRNLHTLVLRSNPIHGLGFSTTASRHSHQQIRTLGLGLYNSDNNASYSIVGPPAPPPPLPELFTSTEEADASFVNPYAVKSDNKSLVNIFTKELFPNLHELSLSFCELYGELEPFQFLPLTTLEISMGLRTATHLHPNTLTSLGHLEWLALDHNSIQRISAFTFYSNRKLNYVNLEWNRIENLPPQLFHPDIHHSVAQVRLSHNKIARIHSHSFISFSAINLDLSYNLINTIDKDAFTHSAPNAHHHQQQSPDSQQLRGSTNTASGIDSLGRKAASATFNSINADPLGSLLGEHDSIGGLNLYLSHNQLMQLKTHVFTSSKFALIDLSHNQLVSFTFATIGPTTIVGTLNLSTNALEQIGSVPGIRAWFKSVDLSHNRLRSIDLSNICVTESLDMSFNRLETINQTCFSLNCSVKELNLNNNGISSLDPNSFANLRDLTVLHLEWNHISLLPPVIFIRNTKLKYLDLSHNRLRTLPRDSLVGSSLETVILSWNRFVNIPVSALSQISRHLKRLDLSHNSIEHLDSTMFEGVSALLHLNLSSNRLNSLPDSAFANLASLRELDLSNNDLRANFKELFHFLPKLKLLRLSNCGIKVFPFLPLQQLISLDLSSNGLHEVKVQGLASLGRLRELDLSHNLLTNSKLPLWTPLHNLKILRLSRNPIKSLTHDTLYGLKRLEQLELQEMGSLERFDSDVFSHFNALRVLGVETYPNIEKYRFRLGAVLSTLPHLEELNVIIKESVLSDQLNGGILPKLRKLSIRGENLKRIEPLAFEGLQNCFQIDLSITHTALTEIPQRLFTLLQDRVWARLDLSFNKLSSLDSSTLYPNKTSWFARGTKLLEGGLVLQGNEFVCDCDLVWLSEWLRRWLRESFQSHSIENVRLLHSTYENMRLATCKDVKGHVLPIVELYSDTICHASALSSATSTIRASMSSVAVAIAATAAFTVLNLHHILR